MLDFRAHDARECQLRERALGVGFHDELLPGLRHRAAAMQRRRPSFAIDLNGAQQSIRKGCMLLGPLFSRQCLNR